MSKPSNCKHWVLQPFGPSEFMCVSCEETFESWPNDRTARDYTWVEKAGYFEIIQRWYHYCRVSSRRRALSVRIKRCRDCGVERAQTRTDSRQ